MEPSRGWLRGVGDPKSQLVYWIQLVVATPPILEMSRWVLGERRRAVRLYRGQIPSPGRPTVAWRQDRVRFWQAIAEGR